MTYSIPFKFAMPPLLRRAGLNPLLLAYIGMVGALVFAGLLAEGYNLNMQRESLSGGPESPTALVFLDLPRMNLTLASPSGSQENVKISLSLEVMRKDRRHLEDFQPRISDRVIGYLHKQDIENIRQPSRAPTLRKSLVEVVNKAEDYQVPVNDVVFEQFLVQ